MTPTFDYAAPAPTLISTIVSLFRRRTPQPTFTPVAPVLATQVYITRDTTTHVDPITPSDPFSGKQSHLPSLTVRCISTLTEKQQHYLDLYPETPSAPHRTTFATPVVEWGMADLVSNQSDSGDDQASISELELYTSPGRKLLFHPTKAGVYADAEPKTLAKALFVFGFLLPAFWLAGSAIILMRLRPTRDWEEGKNDEEIQWRCSIIRETELRWARRCLFALLSEMALMLLVAIVIRWCISGPV